MEGGENEAIARENHLVLRIGNRNRVKVCCSENDRLEKVKIKTFSRMENEHGSFLSIRDSITLGFFSDNRE